MFEILLNLEIIFLQTALITLFCNIFEIELFYLLLHFLNFLFKCEKSFYFQGITADVLSGVGGTASMPVRRRPPPQGAGGGSNRGGGSRGGSGYRGGGRGRGGGNMGSRGGRQANASGASAQQRLPDLSIFQPDKT